MGQEYLLNLQCSGAAFSNMADRFVSAGYKGKDADIPYEKKCELNAKIGGIGAMGYLYDENSMHPADLKKLVNGYGMRVGSIAPDNYIKAKWKHGTFSSRDKEIRHEIVKLAKDSMDFAAESGAIDIMFWLAHDGYDYPFEDNYIQRWGYIVECLREIAAHRPDVMVTVEYKKFEPLTYQYVSDTGKALLLCEQIGLANIGVIVDYGHALFGHENPAESAALAYAFNRLCMIHLNDNYGSADDDLIFGTVSFWQCLEFFWKLHEIHYDGWYVMDNWPARMDGYEATKTFVEQANAIMRIAQSLPMEAIHRLQQENDVPKLIKLLREYTLKC